MPERPVRTCVGCRARRAQDRLIRLHLDGGGRLRVDRTGPGRGAWLCADDPSACLRRAVDRRALARALRRSPDPGSVQALLAGLDANGSGVEAAPAEADGGPVGSPGGR